MDATVRHAARPSVRKDRGPFLFVSRNVYQARTALRGAIFQLTASPLTVATITYQSWQLHLVKPSCSRHFRAELFPDACHRLQCRNAMQDNWLAVGNQIKAATLAKEFRLALVEVARQRLNKYRLTH
jgi:hypothetical protein